VLHASKTTAPPVSSRNIYFALLAAMVLASMAPGAPSQVDCFGIQKIYADAAAPANGWIFTGNPRDPRFMEQYVVAVSDGWFRASDPHR
jgi:hypothetical protein